MKKTFKIDVDCANCAAKMEAAIGKIVGVESVFVNFLAQKLTIVADDESFDEIMKKAQKEVKKVDRGCRIILE